MKSDLSPFYHESGWVRLYLEVTGSIGYFSTCIFWFLLETSLGCHDASSSDSPLTALALPSTYTLTHTHTAFSSSSSSLFTDWSQHPTPR